MGLARIPFAKFKWFALARTAACGSVSIRAHTSSIVWQKNCSRYRLMTLMTQPEWGTPIHQAILSRIRIYVRLFFGNLFNLAGVPGLVRDCNYSGSAGKAEITVKQGGLFTIISVNGLDIYFHRLTGSIDGVGSMSCCKPDQAHESTELPVLPESPHHNARKHST